MDVESDPGIAHRAECHHDPHETFHRGVDATDDFRAEPRGGAGRGDEEEHVKEADGGIPEVVEEIVGELRPERLVFERELHLVLEGVPAGEGEVVLLQEAEGDAVREVGEVVDPRDESVVPFLLIPVLVDPLLAEVEGPYEGAGDEHDEGDGDGKGDQPGDDHRAGIPRRADVPHAELVPLVARVGREIHKGAEDEGETHGEHQRAEEVGEVLEEPTQAARGDARHAEQEEQVIALRLGAGLGRGRAAHLAQLILH